MQEVQDAIMEEHEGGADRLRLSTALMVAQLVPAIDIELLDRNRDGVVNRLREFCEKNDRDRRNGGGRVAADGLQDEL